MSDSAPSILQLIKDAKNDAQHLWQTQSELAKAETSADAKNGGIAAGAFGAALGVAGIGGLFLLLTLAFGINALGLPLWASFGIVTLLLFISAGIAALIGRGKAKKLSGLKVTKAEFERTKKALSGGQSTDVAVPTGKDVVAK